MTAGSVALIFVNNQFSSHRAQHTHSHISREFYLQSCCSFFFFFTIKRASETIVKVNYLVALFQLITQ